MATKKLPSTTTVTATITSMTTGMGPEVIWTMPCCDWAVRYFLSLSSPSRCEQVRGLFDLRQANHGDLPISLSLHAA